MARTLEEKLRDKKEKEQRVQLRKERHEIAQKELQAQERRRALDAEFREAGQKARLAEESRRELLKSRRSQARLDLTALVKQQIKDEIQQEIQSRASAAQEKKQREAAKGARIPVPTKPEKEQRKTPADQEARRSEQIQTIREQRKVRQDQEAKRRAQKELRAEENKRAAPSRPEPVTNDAARQARTDARLRKEQSKAAAQRVRDELQQTEKKRQLTEARRAAARSAAVEKPDKTRLVPERPPQPKPEGRRSVQRKALAAVTPEPPAPEVPLDTLPWLKSRGSFLVDEFRNPVYLRGVTCRGIETDEGAALDEQNLATMIGLWGVNLVRLPLQATTILTGNPSFSANDILARLDDAVEAVTTSKAWVLLSMEAPPGADTGTSADSDIFRAWSLLANHYQDEPGVLYEVLSSPQPLPSDWLAVAAMLVGTIRLQNPASLIFLSSGRGGVDISGLPLRFATGDAVYNIAYTIDVSDSSVPDSDDAQLRAFAASYPLFASPWSQADVDLDRSSEAVSNLFSRYGMGWIASNWNADPRLVLDADAHDFAATRWGSVARRALALPVKPLLPSLAPETVSAWRLG
jgi:hypothetical protein